MLPPPPTSTLLSLHDALPICARLRRVAQGERRGAGARVRAGRGGRGARRAFRFPGALRGRLRSEEHTSELQSQSNLVCRLLLEKKKHTSRSTSNERSMRLPIG